ncbi:MAG: hypothetical protein AAF611_12740 [Bacteroidota bacterium]
MKLQSVFLIVIISLYISCDTGVSNEYLQNVTVDSKGLSCDGIKVLTYADKTNRTEFSYHESVFFLYDNMKGFTLKDSIAYPDMDLHVMTKSGDTLIALPNLFPTKQGFHQNDLNLRTNVIFAKPMLPDNEYVVAVNVSDKNSDAYYHWKRSFSVINSPLIKTKKNGLNYGKQYLFSRKRNQAIVDNVIQFNETVYLVIEDLDGITVDEYGNANVFASIRLTDANGMLINENDNLFPNLVNAEHLQEQLYGTIRVTNKNFKNPITCTFQLADVKNEKSLETTLEFTLIE